MYNECYLQLEEEQRVSDALPELKDKEYKELLKKWGETYEL
jgi:hypothetical protein